MAQRYETYKDSGLQWLGEIPGHWGGTTMGRILSSPLQYGASESGDPTEQPGDWRYIRITDITLDGKLKNEGQKYLPKDIAELYPLEKGDLLFARSGATVGKSYLFNESINACFAGYLIKARINKDIALPEYVSHFTKSAQYDEWKNRIFIQATIQNIGADKYSRLYVPLPPMSEQHAIVSYLDDKCEKIEEWLDKKQKEVEHLHELKQRVIADAVTRGLNPNVTMKQTNISWLPEVPEYWKILRVKHMFNKEQRPVEEGDEIVTCFRDGEVTLRKNRRTTGFTEATDYSHYQHICKGDLVIHQMDAFAGSAGVSDSDGMGTPVLSVCTPKSENILNEYYAHIVRLMGKNGFILSLYRGIRERSSDFRFDTFANLWLPVPPIEEQKQIVAYIDGKTSKIDKLIANITTEIEGIKEYKQRLISDVVTGQIKVC